MFNIFSGLISFLIIVCMPVSVFARCAVCYTKGLSGASIAVIVIILSAFFLFFANRFLQKFIDKNKI